MPREGTRDLAGLPSGKAHRVAAQPSPTRLSGDDLPHLRQQRAPGRVEVVGVLVVREEDRVDRRQRLGGQRRPDQLDARGAKAQRIALPRRVEDWVGEEPQLVDLQQHRRRPDLGRKDTHLGQNGNQPEASFPG